MTERTPDPTDPTTDTCPHGFYKPTNCFDCMEEGQPLPAGGLLSCLGAAVRVLTRRATMSSCPTVSLNANRLSASHLFVLPLIDPTGDPTPGVLVVAQDTHISVTGSVLPYQLTADDMQGSDPLDRAVTA